MTIVISVPKPLQKNPDKNHYIYKYIFIYIVNYFTLFSSNLPAPNMTLSFVIFVIFFPPSLPSVFAQTAHNVK